METNLPCSASRWFRWLLIINNFSSLSFRAFKKLNFVFKSNEGKFWLMITNYFFDDLFLTLFIVISLRTRIDIVETFFAFQEVQPAKVKKTLRPVNFSKQFKRSKWRKSLDAFIFMIPLPPQPHEPNELFPLHSRTGSLAINLWRKCFFQLFSCDNNFPAIHCVIELKRFSISQPAKGKKFSFCAHEKPQISTWWLLREALLLNY